MNMKTINLVYIGDHFYHESGSMMSNIYEESGNRSDWGFVECLLRDGNNITIRQATAEERANANSELDKLKNRRKNVDSTRQYV